MTSPAGMPPEKTPRLSIIFPAYNEEHRIGPTLREYAAHFREAAYGPFELVVVLNGCRDDTHGVVMRVMAEAPEVRMLEFARPLGKGGAIWEGFAAARGELLVFADADNMVRAPETERLVRALADHDIAIADRFGGVSEGGNQPLLRWLISALSRLWVRRFLGLPYRDTQCGAKAFRGGTWRTIAPRIWERGWAFDLDVLAHALATGVSVAEVPVRWRHVAEDSKVRAWIDVPKTLFATFGIRRRARRA
jgi:glycosyltransferase involved in cell wall biosynthesis